MHNGLGALSHLNERDKLLDQGRAFSQHAWSDKRKKELFHGRGLASHRHKKQLGAESCTGMSNLGPSRGRSLTIWPPLLQQQCQGSPT